MTENSVRGAARSRGGATDTTMLIWKVIAANPGISRQDIWEQVEHSIPEGYAQRRYVNARRNRRGVGARTPAPTPSRARHYVLTDALCQMRALGSITWEGDGADRRYNIVREPSYHGNAKAIDETGTKATEHMAIVEALRIAEKMLARANLDTKHGPLVYLRRTEYQAVALLVKAVRAKDRPA